MLSSGREQVNVTVGIDVMTARVGGYPSGANNPS
jgi:hypothetical protein